MMNQALTCTIDAVGPVQLLEGLAVSTAHAGSSSTTFSAPLRERDQI